MQAVQRDVLRNIPNTTYSQYQKVKNTLKSTSKALLLAHLATSLTAPPYGSGSAPARSVNQCRQYSATSSGDEELRWVRDLNLHQAEVRALRVF